MILYKQGLHYWHEMQRFNANKGVPGMALHTVEKLQDMLPTVTSTAVRNRIQGFLGRHAPRS